MFSCCIATPLGDGAGSSDTMQSADEDDYPTPKRVCFSQEPMATVSPVDSMRVFNDPVHGHIELDPLCVKLIDTPQFQRLRRIKQLGGTYFVFPGASHNRFEHCIGVCHLSGELVERLRNQQPELGITDEDVLCVKIAGLCHDLGHGPFSHMFDGRFIPSTNPGANWHHEMASVTMFDHMLAENDLNAEFYARGLYASDIQFVKEQIAGPLYKHAMASPPQPARTADPDQSPPHSQPFSTTVTPGTADLHWPYRGRPRAKGFLYEVVANKRNGIDVDKWDYFARDCHNLGIANSFDYRRFLLHAKVLRAVDDESEMLQICARDKEVSSLYDMFHTRNSLHRRAYQHKVANIVEHMICDALQLANDHLRLPGKDGKLVKMSDAIYDMHAYTLLTDDILSVIQISSDVNLRPAQKILHDIARRRLFKSVGQTQPDLKVRKPFGANEIKSIEQSIFNLLDDPLGMTVDDIVVHVVKLDYGAKEQDPVENVRFYTKENPDRAVRIRKNQVSQMLPEQFAEQHVRIYSKRRDRPALQRLQAAFHLWCQTCNCLTPKGSATEYELTPAATPMKFRTVEPSPSKNLREAAERMQQHFTGAEP